MNTNAYADGKALVSTGWLAEHLNDKNLQVVESNEDMLLYDTGHIPGAVKIDWTTDLNDPVRRDYLDREHFEKLMREKGISNDTLVVFYGDKNNWWAAYALWVFHLFGHTNTALLNGGRKKWMDEGRTFTREKPITPPTNYTAPPRDDSHIRAFRDEVLAHVRKQGALVDVRSPQEYTGERLHMPDYPNEGALRGGHIPGAQSIPWAQAIREDGTFKSADELTALYGGKGITPDKDVIAYCRIGERSSHTWFVLSHLLGFKNVKNYDGSWTEWGNGVGLPIEK
ncbi:MAG TPA: sulfurtransferase [Thermoflexales bacterium]|nr:sulfurtransferase [Thermoflexales bacterium]HQW34632.1 sulfurtransferase [Thermoflexales bacterium]HQX75527.1 sulfurtransferase [Thermoflexales bacterium]HQZ23123.1 sulfurtransferase [Thermoflexales bacterium]